MSDRKTIRAIERLTAPLRRQLRQLVARGVVRLIDDAAKCQRLQVSLLADETRDRAEHIQPYGLTAHPFPGADAVVLHPFGQRSHPLVILVGDRRYRLTGLAQGEVALYDDQGQKIVLKRGRKIEVDTDELIVKAATKARFETPLVEVTGDVVDNLSGGNSTTIRGMRSIYDSHVHPENDNGGPTDAPNTDMGGS